jgi:type VI secretion system protein ImpK
MTPKFSEAVDPVFTIVLDILDRIERREPVDPEKEHVRLRDAIAKAESVAPANDFRWAKFALIAWADEMLVAAPWPGAAWWNDHVLEFEYYKTRDRATVFYTNAAEAKRAASIDALEVYYLCVILGFRGFYRDDVHSVPLAENLGLPRKIDDWVEQTGRSIVGARPPAPPPPGTPGDGAYPLEGVSHMLSSFLLAALLGAVVLVFMFFASFSS